MTAEVEDDRSGADDAPDWLLAALDAAVEHGQVEVAGVPIAFRA